MLQSTEELRSSHEAWKDSSRDRAVENQLHQQKVEEMTRQISSLEAEVVASRALLDTERKHRRDAEQKFEEEELKKFHSSLSDHQETVNALRAEVSDLKSVAEQEKSRCDELRREIESLQDKARRGQDLDQDIVLKIQRESELRQENDSLVQKNEELRGQLKATQLDMRLMVEDFQRRFGEHSQNEHVNWREQSELKQHVALLGMELTKAKQDVRDAQVRFEEQAKLCSSMQGAVSHVERLQHQLSQAKEEFRICNEDRNRLNREMEQKLNKEKERLRFELRDDIQEESHRNSELEAMLADRNHEIKLLMFRVQELSSNYVPTRGDAIDAVVAKWVNGYKPAVPFFRLSHGLYLFGRRQVLCKIVNDKPVFRVGGGFIGFDRFLELYASEELERLLAYEIHESSGEPKFARAHKAHNAGQYTCEFRKSSPSRSSKSASPGRGPRLSGRDMQHQRCMDDCASSQRSSRRSLGSL